MESSTDPPPPYEATEQQPFLSRSRQADQDALLDRVTDHITRQRDQLVDLMQTTAEARADVETETERVRNMLKFTLAVDYQIWASAPNLSAADREHFLFIVHTSRRLQEALPVRPTPEERRVLAAFFWKYLHQPCKALALPLEYVFQNMINLAEFVNAAGNYKGSVHGILHTRGIDQLAMKFWVDREIGVPAVFKKGTSLDRFHAMSIKAGMYSMTSMYFTRIPGVVAESSAAAMWNAERGFLNDTRPEQHITYTVNKRGMAYASSRKAALVSSCMALSTADWMGRVGLCLHEVLRRFAKWQSGATDVVEAQEIVHGTPWGWQYDTALHLPDLFEVRNSRAGPGGCDL